ncbi:MAG: response regulator [Lachnospiraceae bacterium]|nr:response regulator [Lachnospiraceae bacterium]
MVDKILYILLIINTAVWVVGIYITIKRKRAQRLAAIRTSNLYQTILNETQTGVVAHDIKTGEIFYANDRLKEIYNVEGDVSNLEPDSFLMQERGKKHLDLDYEALKNGASNEAIEYHDTGRIYQVKGKIIDWYGREAYVEYMFDVTDSKRFSEQLQLEHEELQRKYQEEMLYREKAISDDVISSSRINLSHGYVEEMRIGTKDGYEKTYHYAMDLVSRIAAFTNQVWMDEEQNLNMSAPIMLRRYLKGERAFSEEFMAELKDGRHVWLRSEAKIVQRPETAEIIAFCYNRNITREKILTNILERIMEFDYDEIFTIDSINGQVSLMATGRYVMDEQIAEGDYAQELSNLKLRAGSKADEKKIETELQIGYILEKLKKEPVFITEVSLMSKNGKARLKQLRFIYLNETLGTLLFTITDIDDMVQAEKQKQEELEGALLVAEEANATKMRFLANMSHEIRTPMNVIIGLTSIIREESANQQKVLKNADRLEATSRYLLTLLNDVLDMARVETGSVTLNKYEFSRKAYWQTINTIAQSQANAAEVNYVFEYEEGKQDKYIGDAVRLQQILINLINNAIKFTPKGGTVTVRSKQIETVNRRVRLQMQVADTGIGMSKEFLPKVFDAFAQEHDATTSSYGGSGLGLSIAKNFARMMGGDITVESEEGVGTTFTVEVWLDMAVEQKENGEDELIMDVVDIFRGKRILLVEDHPLNTVVAKRLLEKQRMEVVHAENGQEAIDYFVESEIGEFDAILMDVRMPVMDGIMATEKIRALEREDAQKIPIIAMTANAFDEDKQHTYEAGMNAHLAKPIEPRMLYDTLAQQFNSQRVRKRRD